MPKQLKGCMRVGIMELAIHDLPLVRRLLPLDALPRVTSARLLHPFGYALNIAEGDFHATAGIQARISEVRTMRQEMKDL